MPIVELQTPEGRRLLINVRSIATSVFYNNELVLNFDRKGGLTGAWIGGRNYRRSLDNRIIEKEEGPVPGLSYRVRRELGPEEGRDFLQKIYELTGEYRNVLADAHSGVVNDASPAERQQAIEALDRVLECDLARLEQDAARFHNIFKTINILPPDQYLSLVLQATEGCSYNHCAFCGFYRDRRFRIKPLEEFESHVRDVRSFFGQAINLRQTIFLADANALVIPQSQLLPIFDLINKEFEIEPPNLDLGSLAQWKKSHPIHFKGIYSFIDAFTTKRKSTSDFAELAARGLRRVYVGLESGNADLLRFLGKPNSPQDALGLVRQVKAGGVAVGVVILAGAGGEAYGEKHVQATADIVNAMSLERGDLIYFSELVDYPGSSYSTLAKDARIRPLTVGEIEEQIKQIRSRLVCGLRGRGPKISYYDIREFVY